MVSTPNGFAFVRHEVDISAQEVSFYKREEELKCSLSFQT